MHSPQDPHTEDWLVLTVFYVLIYSKYQRMWLQYFSISSERNASVLERNALKVLNSAKGYNNGITVISIHPAKRTTLAAIQRLLKSNDASQLTPQGGKQMWLPTVIPKYKQLCICYISQKKISLQWFTRYYGAAAQSPATYRTRL